MSAKQNKSKSKSKTKTTKAETNKKVKSKTKASGTKKLSSKIKKAKKRKLANKAKQSSKKGKNNIWLSLLTWTLLFFISFTMIDFLFQYFNNSYSAAVVNGKWISHKEYISELEKVAGESTIALLIEKQLVFQEAEATDTNISEKKINETVADYAQYLSNGQDAEESQKLLIEQLEQQDMSLEEFKENVRMELLTQELVLADMEISDEQLQQFFDDYKTQLFPEEEDPSFDENKEEIRKAYENQQYYMLKTGYVAELQEKANIKDNIKDKPSYGVLKTTRDIVSGLKDKLQK